MGLRCLHTSIFIETSSLEGLPTNAKEDSSPHEMRLSPAGHQPSISWSWVIIIIIIITIIIITIIIIINIIIIVIIIITITLPLTRFIVHFLTTLNLRKPKSDKSAPLVSCQSLFLQLQTFSAYTTPTSRLTKPLKE